MQTKKGQICKEWPKRLFRENVQENVKSKKHCKKKQLQNSTLKLLNLPWSFQMPKKGQHKIND